MVDVKKTIECELLNELTVSCNGTIFKEPEVVLTPDHTEFWIYLGIYVFLTLFAGMMSGLTMGLLSLDKTQLEILQKVGKPKERKYASTIYPLVKRHHLLLVTLLLWNAVAVESMPIFMDKITNPIVAIVISVTAVLIFGEIVPQALCTRYGLAIGYYSSWFVKFLMLLMFIISWPISKLLDCMLGSSHATFFRRAELKELVNMHQDENDDDNEEPLTIDEVLIIKGALDLRDKVAKDCMVPLDAVFMLAIDTKLDLNTMTKIIDAGNSRIPIYDGSRNNLVGLLLVKTIITLDPNDAVPIKNVMRTTLHKFGPTEPLYNILNACQTGKSHMCVVEEADVSPKKSLGIVTLEDVIEEILQEEIVDETDKYIDVAKRIKVANFRNKVSQGLFFRPRIASNAGGSVIEGINENVQTNESSPLLHSLP